MDAGCGGGAYLDALERDGISRIGADINQKYAGFCRERGHNVVQMDAQAMAFASSSFDSVILIEVLEHLESPRRALERAFTVARKNVLVSVPNIDVIPYLYRYGVVPWHLLEASHLTFFTPKLLETLMLESASDVEIYYYGKFAHWVDERELYMQLFAAGSR